MRQTIFMLLFHEIPFGGIRCIIDACEDCLRKQVSGITKKAVTLMRGNIGLFVHHLSQRVIGY